jgi:hypothetical protein
LVQQSIHCSQLTLWLEIQLQQQSLLLVETVVLELLYLYQLLKLMKNILLAAVITGALIIGYILGGGVQSKPQGPGYGYHGADDYFIPTVTFSNSYTPSLDKVTKQLRGPQCVEPTRFLKITE